jgi:hypothetical protein
MHSDVGSLVSLANQRSREPISFQVLVEFLAVYNLPPLWPCILGTAMDERVEALLADILALEGEDPNVIREGVRGALADCEQLFRAQEVNKRMKDKAAHACHALFRARLVEEARLRKGTSTAEHLKVVLSIIDGPSRKEIKGGRHCGGAIGE